MRPDETLAGQLPNEDAQSFVFDATNLFDRDKFSGYDRIEGGTRANSAGAIRAASTVAHAAEHLRSIVPACRRTSFATDDLVSAGANRGFKPPARDYVTMFGLTTP